MGPSFPRLPVLIGLFLAGLVFYWPALQAGFLSVDDPVYVTSNRHVLSGLTLSNLGWAWSTLHAGYWQPITWMSLQLDASLWGTEFAWGFHLTNLVLHAANACLLFWIVGQFTDRWGLGLVVAGLFLVHPLHVESVVWITERKDVLSTFFLLACLLAYHRYLKKRTLPNYCLVVGCFFLGLASKPMLVTVPFLLLLIDYWPGQRRERFGRLVVEKVPLLAMALVLGLITLAAQTRAGATGPLDHLPLAAWSANAVYSLGWYVGKTLVPTDLAVFYPYTVKSWMEPPVLLWLGFWIALGVLLVVKGKDWPEQRFGWGWFLIALLPVLGIIQAGDQARADRFTYLAHVGLLWALVWAGERLLEVLHVNLAPRATLAAAAILAYGWLGWAQMGLWQNEIALWTHTLDVTTRNHRAHSVLALELVAKGVPELAEPHIESALAIHPRHLPTLLLKSAILDQQGKFQEALAELQAVGHLYANDPSYNLSLGALLVQTGSFQEAIPRLEYALRTIAPTVDIFDRYARALAWVGKNQNALAILKQARVLAAGDAKRVSELETRIQELEKD